MDRRRGIYQAPGEATLRRVLGRVDGDALDGAIGAWLASQDDGARAIAVDGKPQGSFNADLKQAVGSDYETGPIEVGPPIEDGTQRPYRGPFSQTEFAKEAAAYFRSLVGSQGGGIRLGSGSQNVRMRGNRFIVEKTVSFSAPSAPSGVW